MMKDDSNVFLLGYIFCASINFNSLCESSTSIFFMTTILCIKKNGAQDIYAYGDAVKFSILQENPSLKQTENFICKLLSS